MVKSYKLMQDFAHHVVCNTLYIYYRGNNFDTRTYNAAKISFQARPRSLTLHSLVARQHKLPCDLSKK